jgi:alkanesulfonate monooxygenase SsuD/methylene tetrahydromethanopterin reductase-like flavin-dependent oxidoreductase (luciferase family)
MNRQVYVVDSGDPAKIEAARENVMRRGLTQYRLGESLRQGTIPYAAGKVSPIRLDGEPAPEVFADAAVFGSPEMVIEQLRSLRDDIGVAELNVMTDHGGLSFAEARRSVELLGKEVLPVLKAEQVARAQPVPA